MRANRKEQSWAMYLLVRIRFVGHCVVVFLIPRQEREMHSPDQGVRIGCHSLTVLGVTPRTNFWGVDP